MTGTTTGQAMMGSSSSSSSSSSSPPQHLRIRDLGYTPGQLPTGPKNSILDVPGVRVGQVTKVDGERVRSGVTVILARDPAEVQIPCYAGMHTLNGNGEVTGSYQIKDWGYINTPIALTNSTSLGTVYQGIWNHVLEQAKHDNKALLQLGRDYGTPVVGETADWWLNDVYSAAISDSHVRAALALATSGAQPDVLEGQHGGGAGMTCHEFLGGTGTSSRLVNGEATGPGGEVAEGKYTVGVLCQSNYGHKKDMRIGGVPIGALLLKEASEDAKGKDGDAGEEAAKTTQKPGEEEKLVHEGGRVGDGSIVIIIITNCPMLPHQLTRLAQRATIGLAQVGAHGTARNHSGDIFLALSTANRLLPARPRHPQGEEGESGPPGPCFEQYADLRAGVARRVVETNLLEVMKNECVDAVFRAASEAVEEAVLNSVVASGTGLGTGPGRQGRKTFEGGVLIEALPGEKVRRLLERYLVVV